MHPPLRELLMLGARVERGLDTVRRISCSPKGVSGNDSQRPGIVQTDILRLSFARARTRKTKQTGGESVHKVTKDAKTKDANEHAKKLFPLARDLHATTGAYSLKRQLKASSEIKCCL